MAFLLGFLSTLLLSDSHLQLVRRSLFRSDGVPALYRGVLINACKVSLGTGATFVLYELLKDCLSVDGRLPPWEKHGHQKRGRGAGPPFGGYFGGARALWRADE